jgi:hypothetical protein
MENRYRLIDLTDTKERPFTCRCGSSFSRKDLLKRYIIIAHSGEKENHTRQDAENQLPCPERTNRTSLSPNNTQCENRPLSRLTQNFPDETICTSGFTEHLNETGNRTIKSMNLRSLVMYGG